MVEACAGDGPPPRPARSFVTAVRSEDSVASPRTVSITLANWFEARPWLDHGAVEPLVLELSDGDGATWSDLPLSDLRALHFTFGGWRAAATHEPALGACDHLLTAMRARIRAQAETALASAGLPPAPARLTFPPLSHPLLERDGAALHLLRHFLAITPSPSLTAWITAIASGPEATAACLARPWLRLAFQKAVAETRDPGATAVLRAVYGDETTRGTRLVDDAAAVAASGQRHLAGWTATLGLDRAPRTMRPWPIPVARPAPAGVTPDVTVLVPAYRHGRFIEETLGSVLAQTHEAFVVHVVDDQSPDDTVARARRVADPRVHVRVNERSLGLGDSVLAALDAVETPFVALLNSDDAFAPTRLAASLAHLARDPRVQVVATGLVPIDAAGQTLDPASVRPVLDGFAIADWLNWHDARCHLDAGEHVVTALLERNFLVTSSNIVCRTAFLRALAPRLRGLQFCLDWQIFLDAALDGALAIDPAPLLAYRLHGTNTVWFDEVRAVAYRLEANRVLAGALARLAPSASADAASVTAFADAVATHAARHSDARGLALFAVQASSGAVLERARRESPAAHAAIAALTAAPAATSSAGERALAAQVLAELAWEEAAVVTGTADALRHEVQTVQRQTDGLAADLDAARDEARRLEARLHEQQRAHDRALDDAASRAASDLAQASARATADAEAEAARRAAAVAAEHAAALATTAAEHAAALQKAAAEHAAARQTAAAEHAAALQKAEADQQAAVEKAAAEAAARTQAAIAQVKSAPEYLLGDRLWNRLGLSRLGVPAVRALHNSRDTRNRAGLALRGLARTLGLAKPGAVVAACWSFPIHSQTFVYQEMSALSWAGLDYRVFCCDTNPRTELPSAFAGLWDKRLVMQTDWERGQQDLAHFRRTRPERVVSLLATLSRATGRSEESLLNESIVLTGFTFARHLELNGTRYVHTYFFYDQSFLGLMAAYLLEIPRGITAYADHMLGDYQFKLVPLHLELADIVVATSARIKRELGEIGGGRVDDKIIVKPNGIDVSRFRYVPAAERLALPGVPELVAVNRIEPKKGLIHLVEAMAILRDRGIAARANIVGGVDVNTPTSAACHREIVERIDALGLHDAVILHGVKQQHEFAPIAARARMFVAPYVEVGSGDKDGIPTAVLEAMSTGLPIVATDAGSIVEASRPDIEALIVPQRDALALADAIARLLTDRETYVRMSDAARARAVGEFDITVTEVRLHERIARALARR